MMMSPKIITSLNMINLKGLKNDIFTRTQDKNKNTTTKT